MTATLTENDVANLEKIAELRGLLGQAHARIGLYRAVIRQVLEVYPSPDGNSLLHEVLCMQEESVT